jgi:LDH2 family malate/lactate/ureidoglycolate dehydrogenase
MPALGPAHVAVAFGAGALLSYYLTTRSSSKVGGSAPAAKGNASQPAQACVQVKYEELLSFCEATLVASGSSTENAAQVARVLVKADLRGIPSHGVNRLYLYCDELRRGAVKSDGSPFVVSESASAALVDGDNAQGAVVGDFCMDLAIKKARETGVGWVAANNTNHYGIAGHYAMAAARAGMIGMSFTNTSPVVIPTRASKPALGTNPIAIAAPCSGGDPVVLDMSTPCVPLGR